ELEDLVGGDRRALRAIVLLGRFGLGPLGQLHVDLDLGLTGVARLRRLGAGLADAQTEACEREQRGGEDVRTCHRSSLRAGPASTPRQGKSVARAERADLEPVVAQLVLPVLAVEAPHEVLVVDDDRVFLVAGGDELAPALGADLAGL